MGGHGVGGAMDVAGAWTRVKRDLCVGGDREEEGLLDELWSSLVDLGSRGKRTISALDLPLIEEAVVWRLAAMRIEKVLGRDGLFPSAKDGAQGPSGPVHPALEVLAKARERFRKVMKELMERLGEDGGAGDVGLAGLLEPILAKSEDVLKDEIERAQRKKSARKKRSRGRRNRGGADAART